jgi:ABC-type bacteriocin/lantibiotic exporter with double-glycine peptidase domain
LKDLLQPVYEVGGAMIDYLCDITGYAAVRVPLKRASGHNEKTLDLPGYRQVDSYSCGAIAVAMIVKCLRPTMDFERIYAAVNPHREYGTPTTRAIRGMRSLGVGVSRRTNLTFDDICASIEAGRPIMVCVKSTEKNAYHWTVIYGYSRRPNLVFVAGRGLHFLPVQQMKWPAFRKEWSPPGEGLVCWKARRRNARPSFRPAQKK